MHRCIERNICITKMRNYRKVRNKHSVLIHWIPQQFPIADFCLCSPACIPLSTIICSTCVRHLGSPMANNGILVKIGILAQNEPFWNRFDTIGCIFPTSFAPRVVLLHVFHWVPPFVRRLQAIWGLPGLQLPNVIFLAQNLPFWDRFDTAGCTFLTSFATRVVLLN